MPLLDDDGDLHSEMARGGYLRQSPRKPNKKAVASHVPRSSIVDSIAGTRFARGKAAGTARYANGGVSLSKEIWDEL